MKKALSTILAIIMLTSVLAPCQSVIAAESERRSVSLFSNRVTEFNEEYESDSDSFESNFNEDNPNAVENRLIVKTKKEIKDTESTDSVYGLDYGVLQYDDKGTMLDEYEELKDKGYIVQKDTYLHTYAAANPEEAKWYMDSVSTDYAKSEMLNSSAYKNEIVVGVIDSGVNYEHEVFADRITDTTFNMSGSGNENDCMDDYGHGTGVAGIIALNTPDNVKIKPYKVMNNKGSCTLSTFIAAMEVILASNDKPDIMNLSLGAYNPYGDMDIQTDLINELIESGVTVCIASGNDNIPIEYISPANCESAIIVGAYDSNHHICSFSNYGKEVDIAAPGEKIYTAGKKTDTYTAFTGTSAACPFVSSACAYILMQNPKLSPAEVENEIKASAIYMGEDEEMYFGSGMLNLANMIDNKQESAPIPDISGGYYDDTQTITFKNIPDDTQLVYTLDKTIPNAENGIVYKEPIIIDNEMQLNYALIQEGEYASNISSQYYTVQYIADENDFEITDDGVITAYNGDKNNIIVPDMIKGIVPVSVGVEAFKECTLTSITLPDSITKLLGSCFDNSKNLKYFYGKNIWNSRGSFYKCSNLRDVYMPDLIDVSSYTFAYCTMLHSVDFGESLEYLGMNAFESSGITNVAFPNVTDSDIESTFKNSTIMTCDISNNEILSSFSFYKCHYLYELNAHSAIEVGYLVVLDTYYLEEIDLSSAVDICAGAFNQCYIDTLYAPECQDIFTWYSACGLGYKSYIRVVDMPKLNNVTSTRLFQDMFVEEIYLESIEELHTLAFQNLPALKVLYLPKAKSFGRILVDYGGEYPVLPQWDIVWIPNVIEIDGPFTIPDTAKLIYAPGIEKLTAESYNATFVLSEKANRIYIDPTREGYENNVYPTIIAPKDSYAWTQWPYSDEDPMTYIDSDSIIESKGAQIRTSDNGLRFGFMLDESVLGFDLSEYENLYSRINKEYGFAYSFDAVDEKSETVSMDLRAGNENTKLKEADKRNVDGDVSYYNAVFTNIPHNHLSDEVSARAYMCIDGMYFYSPVKTRSFEQVANAVIADDTVDENIKTDVIKLINQEG